MTQENQDSQKLFDQLNRLMTEQRNPNTMEIDLASAEEIVRMINREDAEIAASVEKKIPEIAQAVEAVKEAIQQGGRLLYFGAGTSGRLGIVDAAECPPTFGTHPETVQGFIAGGREAVFTAQEGAEDSESDGAEEAARQNVRPPDVVCGLAASGRTPWVHGALKEAARRGCRTVLITTVPASQVELKPDIMIDVVVGPEVIMGSTRMKSATAQKMVLTMITTGSMIRLGKVYENVMVDLMLTNEKLHERAKRIIMMLSDVEYEEAARLLSAAGGHVKTALVMALSGLDKEGARELLERHDGFIRKAIQELGPKKE